MTKLEQAKKWVDEAEDSEGKKSATYCLSLLNELLNGGCTATTCGMRWRETRTEFFKDRPDPTKEVT